LQAQQNFGRAEQIESEWQAWVVAALASRAGGQTGQAQQYGLKATELLTKLEGKWGADAFSSYANRPDVRQFRKQLAGLSSATK